MKPQTSNSSPQRDPWIEGNGKLRGVMIDAGDFTGWDDFAALKEYFRFVSDHHKQIAKVAIVSDAKALSFASEIVKHFVKTEVRHFTSSNKNEAMQWLAGDSA